jgi:hypothetical protein
MAEQVNHPDHYNKGGVECLQAMEASMTDDEFLGFLKGSIIKYLWRYRHKGKGSEDLGKATFYLKMLADRVKAKEEKAKAVPVPVYMPTPCIPPTNRPLGPYPWVGGGRTPENPIQAQ